MTIDPQYGVITSVGPWETVRDDLTRELAVVLKIEFDEFGNAGIWLDNPWAGGGRFPWEISPPMKLLPQRLDLNAQNKC